MVKEPASKNHNENADFNRSLDPVHYCGIDIGSKESYVAVVHPDGQAEVKKYSFHTRCIQECAEWLIEHGVRHVAMESTGVYWIPIYDILEQHGLDVILVNAAHIKNVPGRKTDVQDCQWIQQLHTHGLLRASHRPPDAMRPLRAFVRLRADLVAACATQKQRMQKALIQMNIRLEASIANILGATGLSILTAILNGERDPEKLAAFRRSSCKSSREEFKEALRGNWREEHLFELRIAYECWQEKVRHIEACDKKILEQLLAIAATRPQSPSRDKIEAMIRRTRKKKIQSEFGYQFEKIIELILGVDCTKVPGVSTSTVLTFIAECGVTMKEWPSSKHFASWLGVCPKPKITGGKVISGHTLPTKSRAATAFRISSMTVSRSSCALGALYHRARGKMGGPKAITCVAHKIAVTLYTMVKNSSQYDETISARHEKAHAEFKLKRLKRDAEAEGFILVPKQQSH